MPCRSIAKSTELPEKTHLNLSVVIASVNGPPIIEECLDSLSNQSETTGVDVIVAHRWPNAVETYIARKYPKVKLLKATPQSTIPQMRALGFRESSGDIVAVLEDHCIVPSDWARLIIGAHRFNHPVIGGSVENAACQRFRDWAAFFCEYYRAMKPIPEGEVDFVPGNNVSYKKAILEQFRNDIQSGIWDFTLHECIRTAGLPLYSLPLITAYHKMSASLRWFLVQKFHFARSFAGARFENSSRIVRSLYGGGALFLPLIQFVRIFSTVWKKGRHRTEFFLSLPFLLLMLFSWGIGEAAGYILGPGSSTAKVA